MENKKSIWRIVGIVYIILSAVFILWSLWGYIRFALIQSAYNQGRRGAIEELIARH